MSDFDTQLQAYLDHICAHYEEWQEICAKPDPLSVAVRKQMTDEFVGSVKVERGSKYIKVIANRSVHSFIVAKDTPKFPAGTILKAASWKAPATNFARGNILCGDFSRVTWTGAA